MISTWPPPKLFAYIPSSTDLIISSGFSRNYISGGIKTEGYEWTDDDGNRYGGILMDLEVEYEKVKAKLAKVEVKIDKYNLQ